MKQFRRLLVGLMAFLIIGFTGKAQTVVEVIIESTSHDTLEAAVVAAGLVETLQGEGPFTVFAPTDAAFAALPEGVLDTLLSDPSGSLKDILLYHVVAEKAMSSTLSDGQKIKTVLGQELTVSVSEDGVFINGARVTLADIEAENGVIHVIDSVMMPDMRPATVVDIALGNDDFSTLVAALTREDLTIGFVNILSGEGPFTVFAPTNAAFAALLEELGAESLGDIDAATLEAVLQMHVLSGKVMSGDLSEGLKAETLLGQELIFSLAGGASITDPNSRVSNITAVDLEAQNGVVHAIDTVILSDLRPASVVDIAAGNEEFSTLVAALTRDDLSIDFIAVLTGEGPFTVFAPTNAAFTALLEELGADSLDDIDAATLESVLKMHVLSGKVMSGQLSEGLKAETLLGQELTFSLEGGASITDPNGRKSNITAVDLEAVNGVVHVIDTVILAGSPATSALKVNNTSFDFYPNPSNGFITIQSDKKGNTIRIVDVTGKTLLHRKLVQPSETVDLTNIKPGLYFLTSESEGSKTARKLIVQ